MTMLEQVRERVTVAFREEVGPFETLESLADGSLGMFQRRAAERLLRTSRTSASPKLLRQLGPPNLTNDAYRYYAPIFLLEGDYYILGLDPCETGLCACMPDRPRMLIDAFEEYKFWHCRWLESLLESCSTEQLNALRSHVELYVAHYPGVYDACYEEWWA